MQSNHGLTVKDHNYINNYCKSIAKCEKHGVREKDLRQQIYMLGLYTFRQYHHAGLPADIKHPGLSQQSRNTQTKQYEHIIPDTRMGNSVVDNRTKAILV
tara:strand:+ start:91 stop:390 length:300 start_codon:yes stop_codon:yes gene_type:complete